MLHMVACGQEKKQNQVHDSVKGMTQGGIPVDISKWDDKYNHYTAKCTKIFRFQLNDTTLKSAADLSGIYFLDNNAKVIKFKEIKNLNLPKVEGKINFNFKETDRLINSESVNCIYKLSSLDKNQLNILFDNVKLYSTSKKPPKYMKIDRPSIFVNNDKLILCTELYFYDDYVVGEDKIRIGGRTLIEVYDIKGNKIFEYFDNNAGGLHISDDFRYLLQQYDFFSGDGGGSINPGFKLFDLVNKEKILDYRIANGNTDYESNIERFTSDNLIFKLSDGYSIFELIIVDFNQNTIFRKKYSEEQAKKLSKSTIEIDKQQINFINKTDKKSLLIDNLSTFKIIEK